MCRNETRVRASFCLCELHLANQRNLDQDFWELQAVPYSLGPLVLQPLTVYPAKILKCKRTLFLLGILCVYMHQTVPFPFLCFWFILWLVTCLSLSCVFRSFDGWWLLCGSSPASSFTSSSPSSLSSAWVFARWFFCSSWFLHYAFGQLRRFFSTFFPFLLATCCFPQSPLCLTIAAFKLDIFVLQIWSYTYRQENRPASKHPHLRLIFEPFLSRSCSQLVELQVAKKDLPLVKVSGPST